MQNYNKVRINKQGLIFEGKYFFHATPSAEDIYLLSIASSIIINRARFVPDPKYRLTTLQKLSHPEVARRETSRTGRIKAHSL